MSEIYHDGDDVPREWFSRFENVKSMKFRCECSATIEDDRRVVRRTGDGPYMVYIEPTRSFDEVLIEAKPTIYWETGQHQPGQVIQT